MLRSNLKSKILMLYIMIHFYHVNLQSVCGNFLMKLLVCPCRVYKYVGQVDINPSNIRRTVSQQDNLYLYDMSSCSSKTERNTSCSKEFPIYPLTDICQHNNTTLLNYNHIINHFNNLSTTHNYLQQQNMNELSLSEDENLVKLSSIKDNDINNEYTSNNDDDYDDERNDYLQKVVVKILRKNRIDNDNMIIVPSSQLIIEDSELSHIFVKRNTTNLFNSDEDHDIDDGDDDKNDITTNLCHIPQEIWILCQLKHPAIVRLLDWANEDIKAYYLVMESHGIGMDLFEFIERQPKLDEPLTSYMFRQLVSAVNYLHQLNIAHRDIKDENIIIDDLFHLKLIDFGSAIQVLPGEIRMDISGTIEFCSPEVLLGKGYNPMGVDIWALGITLYTLVFGENPFLDKNDIQIGNLQIPYKFLSDSLLHVFLCTLEPNPLIRITASELECLSWVKQSVNPENYKFNEIIQNQSFSGNITCDYRVNSSDYSI
ncbi:unnamed protein product [Trichobilharzia szidati]|nr:unnamed protein product [Trichobilharzia szidati]